MKPLLKYSAPQLLITLLLLSTAALTHGKGFPYQLHRPISGYRSIPCEEIQVNGNITTYSRCNWHGNTTDPESDARQFLSVFGEELHLDETMLSTRETKSSLTGRILLFGQVYKNHRVHGVEVNVSANQDGSIRRVRSNYFPVEQVLGSEIPIVSAEMAEAVGRSAIGTSFETPTDPEVQIPSQSELVWFPVAGTKVVLLAWKLIIHVQPPFLGDYLTLVDATSGVLLHQENRLSISR